MHKKILITPIAALHGSANLTYSGTETNNENISHVLVSNRTQYDSVAANARTTLSKSEKLQLNATNLQKKFSNKNKIKNVPTIKKERNKFEEIVWEIKNGLDEHEKLEFKQKFSAVFLNKIGEPEKDKTTGIEFKSQDVVDITMKEINGMMNTNGGFVVTGIKDSKWTKNKKPEIVGIEIDSGKSIEDFKNLIVNWLEQRFSRSGSSLVEFDIVNDIEISNGKSVLVFHVRPSKELAIPMTAAGRIEKTKSRNQGQIFIRAGISTREIINFEERKKWEILRFSNNNNNS